MVLGKRHGSLIKRTTSMRMFNVDTTTVYDVSQPSDHDLTINPSVVIDSFTKNDGFLMTCNRCNQNLCHRRDIYMYRGDNAFCSLECREKQIKLDERKVKVSSKKSFRI